MKKSDFIKAKEIIDNLEKMINGGKGSGNWGHVGRPGEIGGSAPAGATSASMSVDTSTSKPYSKMTKDELSREVEKRGANPDYYRDKESAIKYLLEEDERDYNIKLSEGQLKDLEFTDEEIEELNKNGGRVRKYEKGAEVKKVGDYDTLVNGIYHEYSRGGDGVLESVTVAAGNSVNKLEADNSLAPRKKGYKKDLEDLGFKHTSSVSSKIFTGEKWQDAEYRENFQLGNEYLMKGEMMNAPAGKSFSYASISPESYRGEHIYIDATARHYKKVDDAKDTRGIADYSISHLSDNKSNYGVNWSAWGTQDVKTTGHFADGLKEASELADKLTKARAIVDRDWEKKKSSNSTSDVFKNGGKGSGNFGHAGRPGEVGGSGNGGGIPTYDGKDDLYSAFLKAKTDTLLMTKEQAKKIASADANYYLRTGHQNDWLEIHGEKALKDIDKIPDGEMVEVTLKNPDSASSYPKYKAYKSKNQNSLGFFENGGKGSGNWGHAGRPGEVGGSAPAGTTAPSISERIARADEVDRLLLEAKEAWDAIEKYEDNKDWDEDENHRLHKIYHEKAQKARDAEKEHEELTKQEEAAGIKKKAAKDTEGKAETAKAYKAALKALDEKDKAYDSWSESLSWSSTQSREKSEELKQKYQDAETKFTEARGKLEKAIVHQVTNDKQFNNDIREFIEKGLGAKVGDFKLEPRTRGNRTYATSSIKLNPKSLGVFGKLLSSANINTDLYMDYSNQFDGEFGRLYGSSTLNYADRSGGRNSQNLFTIHYLPDGSYIVWDRRGK